MTSHIEFEWIGRDCGGHHGCFRVSFDLDQKQYRRYCGPVLDGQQGQMQKIGGVELEKDIPGRTEKKEDKFFFSSFPLLAT